MYIYITHSAARNKMTATHSELKVIRIEILKKCIKTKEEQKKIGVKDREKAIFD